MRYILFCLLTCSLPAFGQNNIKKNASVAYTQGPPTFTVSTSTSSEIAIDTTTGKIYEYHRPTATWLQLGQGIDNISGCAAPAYTPTRNMSYFAVNNCSPREFYIFNGSTWELQAAGSGSGHVIMEGNTPRAQRDSLEFRSNSIIVFSATNSTNRTIIEGTIQTGGVGTAEIATGAVGNSDIAANAIDSTKVCAGCLALSDINQSGASTGQFAKWSGSAWIPSGIDTSVFATKAYADTKQQRAWATGSIASPVYTPTLTDSIIHNGSVRIRGTYPKARNASGAGSYTPNNVDLYIEHAAVSGAVTPAMQMTSTGDTSIADAFRPFVWALDSNASTTHNLPFSLWVARFPNASAAGHNYTGGIGFNITQAGGRLISGRPAVRLQFEQNYAVDGTNPFTEQLIEVSPSSGVGTYRPFYAVSRSDSASSSVVSIAGDNTYFDMGGALYGSPKGQWSATSLIANSVGTNQNFEFRMSGTGTGSTTLNMRDPNSGSTVPALFWENGRSALQLSPTRPVLFRGNVFAFDNFFGGATIIGNGYPDADNSSDTLNFGYWSGLGGSTYDAASNFRFFVYENKGIYVGEYGKPQSSFNTLSVIGNDMYINTVPVDSVTVCAFGMDHTTGNIGVRKALNTIGSSAALQVGIGGFENAGLVFQGTNEITGTTTVTASTTVTDNLYKPGSTQATLTFNLPASPAANQLCTVCFNNIVTALTVSGNGTTLTGTTPTAAAVGDCFAFKYYSGITAWIRTK